MRSLYFREDLKFQLRGQIVKGNCINREGQKKKDEDDQEGRPCVGVLSVVEELISFSFRYPYRRVLKIILILIRELVWAVDLMSKKAIEYEDGLKTSTVRVITIEDSATL